MSRIECSRANSRTRYTRGGYLTSWQEVSRKQQTDTIQQTHGFGLTWSIPLQLASLDMNVVSEESKTFANTVFIKKSMYYNMRSRIVKRHAGHVIRKVSIKIKHRSRAYGVACDMCSSSSIRRDISPRKRQVITPDENYGLGIPRRVDLAVFKRQARENSCR